MLIVIASIQVKPEKQAEFLEIFKANVPNVLQEDGCIEYFPTVEVNSGLAAQQLEPHTVTIVEKWAGLEALQAHLGAPHMLAYQEKVKGLVEKVSLKLLQPAYPLHG